MLTRNSADFQFLFISRYGIKTFPALVYFRNSQPLTFDGDLKSEESVLEWLIDDENRELEDEIEAVNFRMLDKLLSTSSLIAVFFCMLIFRSDEYSI